MMANHDWTPASIATLRQLWDEGLSTSEIGRRMGLNKNQVVGKAHREGFPKRPACNAYHAKVKPITNQQKQIVRDLWATASYARITQYTGLGEGRIKAVARELGLPERDPSLAHSLKANAHRKSRAVVARPAARAHRELPCSVQRAASLSRPRAATISGVSSAVERLGASPQVENLPEAVAETPPPRVFSGTKCCHPIGDLTCNEPVRANARGLKSPYCPEHFALIYAAPPAKSATNPPPAGWLKNRLAMRAHG
jgi:GcrA cell cycle regulator